VGGIGSCGRELCCSTWLTDFKSVNTAAARYQNLSINQTKLSGQCGRLKCCLNYELDTYLDALQGFPDNCDVLQVAKGNAFLIKKDIFKNLMWYTLPDSNKQYPLTIERVQKIKAQNRQGITPDELEPVDVTTGKQKEAEPEMVELVGQISLRTLEKAEQKKRQQNQQRQQRGGQQGGQQRGGGQQGGGQNRGLQGGGQQGGQQNRGQQRGGGQQGQAGQQGGQQNRGQQGGGQQGGGQQNRGQQRGGGQQGGQQNRGQQRGGGQQGQGNRNQPRPNNPNRNQGGQGNQQRPNNPNAGQEANQS